VINKPWWQSELHSNSFVTVGGAWVQLEEFRPWIQLDKLGQRLSRTSLSWHRNRPSTAQEIKHVWTAENRKYWRWNRNWDKETKMTAWVKVCWGSGFTFQRSRVLWS
jgi:hypothetical protein